jgi:hypothetical protein
MPGPLGDCTPAGIAATPTPHRKCNTSYQPTRPTPIPIGERRKSRPEGRAGYLRIDIVHQGDQDGNKGLYHVNAVGEVTQWEIVAATPQISERLADPRAWGR